MNSDETFRTLSAHNMIQIKMGDMLMTLNYQEAFPFCAGDIIEVLIGQQRQGIDLLPIVWQSTNMTEAFFEEKVISCF